MKKKALAESQGHFGWTMSAPEIGRGSSGANLDKRFRANRRLLGCNHSAARYRFEVSARSQRLGKGALQHVCRSAWARQACPG